MMHPSPEASCATTYLHSVPTKNPNVDLSLWVLQYDVRNKPWREFRKPPSTAKTVFRFECDSKRGRELTVWICHPN